jgi:hypothetical protein
VIISVVTSPSADELERRMRPGAWSDVGFLGLHERLEDVLQADALTLAELGLTASELAEPLALLIQAPLLSDREPLDDFPFTDELRARDAALRAELERRFGPVEETPSGTLVGGRYQVDVTLTLGVQECPWSPIRVGDAPEGELVRLCGGGSGDWWIRNLARREELDGPELIEHLIGEHGFFEGRESPYRVDPERLARLLELGPFAR